MIIFRWKCVYFSSEDDNAGVRVVEWDECGGGDGYRSAGYDPRGQRLCRVQVEHSLTATGGRKRTTVSEMSKQMYIS